MIMIDGKRHSEHDIPDLLATWCTNNRIRQTHNFQLVQSGKEIFSFHDGPRDILVAYSELSFIQQLRAERLIRYDVVAVAPPGTGVWSQIKTAFAKIYRRNRSN